MTEKLRRHLAFCPHCGNTSPQRVVLTHTYHDTWYGSDGKPWAPDEGPESETIVCICDTCEGVLLYDGVAYIDSGQWPDLGYPRDTTLPKDVPASVREIYAEARVVKQNAPNAFAMMIRKALEAICDDRGAPGRTLQARLKHLTQKGEVPPVLSEMTDVLRIVGNTAAHGSLQAITQPMTWAIDEFFRAVVEYVYIGPSKLTEFKKKLAATKQSNQ